jgi:hypothetical protein
MILVFIQPALKLELFNAQAQMLLAIELIKNYKRCDEDHCAN